MEFPVKDKIHVLHLVQGLGVGGAEVLLLHYIKALGTESYKHYVYCFGLNETIKSKLECIEATVHMGPTRASIKNPFKFTISLFILLNDLSDFIKRHRIHIIQSHLSVSNQLGVILGKLIGIPTFPTVHNTMAFKDNRSIWDLRVHLIRFANAVIYRIADYVIAVSQEIKEIIQDTFGLSGSRVLVLKNGIVFEDSIVTMYQEDDSLSTPNTIKLIGVGSLTYQKAFEVLVRATAELLKQGFDNLRVFIVGEGIERGNLEDLIETLGAKDHVKLLGLRDDIINLLKTSDVFVMPSRYEGLSIAMIEAMACGLPIVASDAPGLGSYIAHEKNGLLFPVSDHITLAKSILRVVNEESLKARLSFGARQSFETEFNMFKNIKMLDKLFRRYAKFK